MADGSNVRLLGVPGPLAEIAADVAQQNAAGIVFVAGDGDVLLLRRASSETNYPGHWALPGGKAEGEETPEEAAERETTEEIGKTPKGKMRLLDRRITPNGFIFSTFAKPVDDKFVPKLNEEHSGYCWAPLNQLPMPMHPAVAEVLGPHLGIQAGIGPLSDYASIQTNFAAWARDFVFAQDSMALDKESVRTIDRDGHMHVARTPISKAVVNGYLGSEIPNWEVLGLEPGRVYQLYRDPDELAKGAHTFARKPILIKHTPISSDDHPSEITVGTIGDDVEFDHPYLMAPLTIWDQKAIDLIESGEQRELSCGYRYVPVMVSGETPSGEAYDGRMTKIEANHLALVEQGRAGPDCVVGDSALPIIPETQQEHVDMAKTPVILSRKASIAHGALMVYLSPKLAKDAKIDLSMALDGVTAKNFVEKFPFMIEGVKKATAGKLAKDAKLDDINIALDAAKEIEAEDDLPKAAIDAEPDKNSKVKEFLKDKLSAEDMKACDAMLNEQEAEDEDDGTAEDEDPDNKGANDEGGEEKVDKKAMDSAITAAVRETEKRVMRTQRDIRTAEDEILPYVGKLAIACDSAADVYKAALGALKIDVEGMHPTAYRPVLLAQPKPGDKPTPRTREATVAMDAAGVSGFKEMYPKAQAVRQL